MTLYLSTVSEATLQHEMTYEPDNESLRSDVSIAPERENCSWNVKTNGIDNDHPLRVLDDFITPLAVHDQMKPGPKDQSLTCNHRIPSDRQKEDGQPFQISRRKIHELEQESECVRDDPQTRYEQRPEVQSPEALEGQEYHECQLDRVIHGQAREEANEDFEGE